jgi:hypothetical protein
VERLYGLKLRRSSIWQVLLALLTTAYRYGGTEARLTIKALAGMTGLSDRSVQLALTELINRGLVSRQGRYGRLRVHLDAIDPGPGRASTFAPPAPKKVQPGSANKLAPPTRNQACASPTSLYSFLCIRDLGNSAGAFSAKQTETIRDVIAESDELLGDDVGQLTIPDAHLSQLGLPPSTTYLDGYRSIASDSDRRKVRDYVRAVLALRRDERVQGSPLLA